MTNCSVKFSIHIFICVNTGKHPPIEHWVVFCWIKIAVISYNWLIIIIWYKWGPLTCKFCRKIYRIWWVCDYETNISQSRSIPLNYFQLWSRNHNNKLIFNKLLLSYYTKTEWTVSTNLYLDLINYFNQLASRFSKLFQPYYI